MKIKKIILAVLMVVTMISASAVSVYADSIPELPSGEEKSFTLNRGYYITYQIVLSQKETVTIDFDSTSSIRLYVADTSGENIRCSEANFALGKEERSYDGSLSCEINSMTGNVQGTAKYELDKGTYYIKVSRSSISFSGSGKVKLKATYGSDKESNAKISYLTLDMEVGDTIRLGTVAEPADAEITWKSSKAKVASVSASGKVTAKKEGSTIITATSGKSKVKIKINVI